MATSTMAKAKLIDLGIEVEGRRAYGTPTGIKLSHRGRVEPAGRVLGRLTKGMARRVRKACYRSGLRGHAAAVREG